MKTVIANWKMNVGTRESVALGRGVLLSLRGRKVIPDTVICPPFVALGEVRKLIARSKVSLGAQNMSWEEQGSFTGEISPRMLEEAGVSHVILGHSERRNILGETDEMINKKLLTALKSGLVPILCIGEQKADRDGGKAEEVVLGQLRAALKGVHLKKKDQLFIAYEPIWAIGTGVSATPQDAVEMHSVIRSAAADLLGEANFSILYGGSVNSDNAYEFLRENEVDGVLVGGASLKLNQFTGIISAAAEVMEGLIEGGKIEK